LLGDRQLAARMGRAARRRAETQYGVERYTNDYEQLYDNLTKTRVHAGTR
jgi:glycosyltransferase involved in cell wall biosynthesis